MTNESSDSSAKRLTWETYSKAWSINDAAERLTLFAQCLHPGCIYTDPATQAAGFGQLADYMADCHARFPGLHFTTTDFLSHHDRSIAHWNMMGGKGEVLLRGVSYGHYGADGKLTQMTGFFSS